MRKIKSMSSGAIKNNMIDYRLRWDMSKYPYATIKTTTEDVDNGFESPLSTDSKHLEKLLGWATKIATPALTATQIYDRIGPVSDEYVISPSQGEKVLLHHPAYVTLEPKDKFSPKGFISRKTLIESACGYLLKWCSQAESKEFITDTLGEKICRLIANPYQLETDKLWTLLEEVGVIEKLGKENISAADMRTFLSFCQYWGLQAEVVLSWDGFQARAQYRIAKPVHLDLGYDGYWLSQFDDDERILIEKRLLDGHTLDELGEALEISREGARQRAKKVIDRLQHPAFRIIFGYVLGQNLFELSSMRLVHPDRIANKMEDYFGRRITNRGLYQILKTIAMVEPIQVYNSDWLWINWGKDFAKLPELELWEMKYNIKEESYLSLARKGAGELSKTEEGILFRCGKESHRSPKRLRSCIIRTLNILKCPAHFKDIAAKAQKLFPDFPGGLPVMRVNSVLKNLERAGLIKKVDRAIYALPEYAEEEILPPESQPPEFITPQPSVVSDLDDDAILEEIENEEDHYKNLFTGLDPKDPEAAREAILRIIKAVEDLPMPRSLCELRINQEGYQWLILWAKHIDASTLRALLDDYEQSLEWGVRKTTPLALGAGLLLLLFATEVGRRESIPSMFWPFIRKRLNDDARKIVFQGNQGINQRFKDVIESTCRKFNLRHVLGQEGTQGYYITMTLQYGLALSHLKQLPLTLTGHKHLRAFDLLLGTDLKSESFYRLFHTLRDFRFNRISRDIATKILDANPWVLHEKTQDVLDATKSVEELEDQLSTPNIKVSGEDDEQNIILVNKPILRWNGVDKPFFKCSLQQLDRMDLNDDRYDLFLGEEYVGSLLQDANGRYGGIEEFRIPLDSPQQIIRLCDLEGKTFYTQELQLWNEEDDLTISVFQFPSGRKIDAWKGQMNTQSQYALITLTDLEFEPSIEPWRLVGEGKWRLILLQKGWAPDLKITFEGEDFWLPLLKDKSIPLLSDWEQKIQIKVVPNTTLEFGEKFDLIIENIPPRVTISHAIFCKKPVPVTTLQDEGRIKNIELTPEIALAVWRGSKIELRLHRNGEKKRLRLPVDLDFMGSVIDRTQWEPMFIGREVTIRELEYNRVQVFVPKHWQGERFQDLALMEGSVFLRRLWKRPRTLGGLLGLGAPLKVQKPYNCLPEEKLLTLSTEVVDRGIIDQVLMDETLIDIFLHRDVEPGPDHFLIGVSPNGLVSQFEIEMHEGRQWLAEIDSPLVACGIAYRGECVGSWWGDHIGVLDSLDAKSIQNVAAMMRWLHLPILKPTWKEKVIRFIETNLVAVLSAWVQDQGLPGSLCFNEAYETWFANIGGLFFEIHIEPEHASTIVDLMIQDQFLNNFEEALHRLGHINPIFMGRVVQALLDSGYKNFKESEWLDHLQRARRRFLYLPSRTSEQDTRNEEERHLHEAAQSMMLHSRFLENVAQRGVKLAKSGHNQDLSAIDRENLEIAMNVQPFNRYLCINIFNDIIRNL